MLTADIPPNQSIYIKNLNEKIKKEELKRSLYCLFSQFGRIVDVVALKTPNLRGQAWVAFSEVTAASNAVRQMQNFPFYDKPMSNCVAKAEGANVAKVPSSQNRVPPAPSSQPQNSILFIQNLPYETTSAMLQPLFQQYPGFREIRMISAKPGIAFVEYEDDVQSSIAMQALQDFKITPQNPMVISFAKK